MHTERVALREMVVRQWRFLAVIVVPCHFLAVSLLCLDIHVLFGFCASPTGSGGLQHLAILLAWTSGWTSGVEVMCSENLAVLCSKTPFVVLSSLWALFLAIDLSPGSSLTSRGSEPAWELVQ